MSFLPLTFQLPFVNAAHFVNCRNLIDSFVVANARDTRITLLQWLRRFHSPRTHLRASWTSFR